MITLSKITQEFTSPSGERLTILDDLSLELRPGTSCSIVGASGSGKSTLLALLAGLEKPTRGQIIIDGQDITSLSERALSRFRAHRTGIVFQSFHLLAHFSALQNVLIAAEISGLPKPKDAALQALDMVGLASRVHHKPLQLSGGEQQRVAIARAIVAKPALLLCDEPTGNLDPQNADKVFSLLLDLHRTLKSVLVLVTHDHTLAGKLAQQVHLERGKIKAIQGNPALHSELTGKHL